MMWDNVAPLRYNKRRHEDSIITIKIAIDASSGKDALGMLSGKNVNYTQAIFSQTSKAWNCVSDLSGLKSVENAVFDMTAFFKYAN